jgi:hypothetical protein
MKKVLLSLLVVLNFNVSHAANDLFPLGEAPFIVLGAILQISGLALEDAIASKFINLDFSKGYDLKNRGYRSSFEILLGIQEGKELCYGLCNPENAKQYSYEDFKKTILHDELLAGLKDEAKVQMLFDGYNHRAPIMKTSSSVRSLAGKIGSYWNRDNFNITLSANSKTAETLKRILDGEIRFVNEASGKTAKTREGVTALSNILQDLSNKK